MSHVSQSRLVATPIELDSKEFDAIIGWPFADAFIKRLLEDDVPQRVLYGNCEIWTFRDQNGSLVGFGTLDLCTDCGEFTNGTPHQYIPLLAVNPHMLGRGFGTSIVQQLVEQATLRRMISGCHDVMFLDVYTTSTPAIGMYQKCGFVNVSQAIPDPDQDGATYIIMAKRIAISPPPA